MTRLMITYLIYCWLFGTTALAEETPTKSALQVELPRQERAKARHILITYYGALLAKKKIRRNRGEAYQLAVEIQQKIIAGDSFKALAIKYGDDTTSARGGKLGSFARGTMEEKFEEAVFALTEEQYAIVETPYGFHVVQRQKLVEVNLIHIVIQWKGAFLAKKTNQRSKKRAKEKIHLAQQELAQGIPPQQVAKKYSDGAYGPRGGHVGWFEYGELSPSLNGPAFQLEKSEVSPIIENGAGYHLLIRVD